MSVQVSSLAGKAPEVAGHADDEDQLDPLGWLEVRAVEADPAFAAENFCAEERDGYQGQDAYAVGPVGDVEQAVVVDEGDDEHQHDADGEEADLFGVEAVEFCVEGGGLDLEDGDEGQEQHEAEEDPVEVAVGGEALHALSSVYCGLPFPYAYCSILPL